MSIQREDYTHFGFPLGLLQAQSLASAMADTGRQSCLAGLSVVKKLGLSTRDLIPVDIEMHAANYNHIRILGATILRLSGKNKKGEQSTRQMVYVTDNTDKLFLSREACVDLGIIPKAFPTINDTEDAKSTNSIDTTDNSTSQEECQCPRRTKPPPIPTSLPFPATEANREKLQQYLLDYYSSSTFNTCENQALPLMDSPLMKLMIDPNATPIAHHSPIPVPLHWQDAVKAGLDRDVRLGVLEPAPIEGEALAAVDALDKARHFVLGCKNLTIAVDHQPLLKIFGDRSLNNISNTRLRNLKEKTLRYRFKMVHIPGVKNRAPDTLSRHPTGDSQPPKMVLHDDVHTIHDGSAIPPLPIPTNLNAGVCTDDHRHAIQLENQLQESLISSLRSTHTVDWEQVQIATSSDENMILLLSTIKDGFPEFKHQLPPPIREYHQFRRHLYSSDGVIIYKDRIVIPPSLRPTCLSALHAAHQSTCTSAMTAKAEASMFWPGITNDIQAIRANCQHCNRMAPSQAALPLTPPILPEYPFQCVCADYFHYQGHPYLVIVDRYSNWPIVERDDNGAQGLIKTLWHTFATYGIPDELSSDGGPEFVAHSTREFLRQWGVHHRLSSVAFPHSNCRAEVGVKTIKRLITGNVGKDGAINIDAFQKAILQYRNTPDPTTKMSPAMCVFGRPIKDLIPILPGKYHPHQTWRESLQLREEALRYRHMRQQEKWGEHTKTLSPLQVGDRVWIQNQTGPHLNKWD